MTFELQPTAEEVGNGIQEIYNRVQRGLGQLVDSTLFAETVTPRVADWVATAESIADDVTAIVELHATEDYSDDVMALEGAVERANQIAVRATGVRDLSQSLNGEAENLIGGLQRISDDVDITSSSIRDIAEELEEVENLLEMTATEVSSLIQDVSTINDVIERAQTEIESSEQVISQTNITAVCESVDELRYWIGMETPAMSGSGTELGGPLTPELGDGMEPAVSGSGMGLAPNSLTNQVARLEEGVESVGVALGVVRGVVSSAVDYGTSLQEQADMICRYVFLHTFLHILGLGDIEIALFSEVSVIIQRYVLVVWGKPVSFIEKCPFFGGTIFRGSAKCKNLILSLSILSESLDSGGTAVEVILNYTSSVEAIEEALRVATETREVLEEVGRVVTGGEGEELRRETRQLFAMSETLLSDAREEGRRAEGE